MNHTMMNRKSSIVALFIFLASSTIFPVFDLSPWIVVHNTTKFDVTCHIQAICHRDDFEDEDVTIITSNNENITVECFQEKDELGNDFMKITIGFICKAELATAFNPMFYRDDTIFNPQIKSVSITYETLQLTDFYDITNPEQRYFSIEYQEDAGITMHAQEISLYIRCLNNFKQTLRNIVIAALNATNYLPY